MRYTLAVWAGKLSSFLLHLIAPKRGTNKPGVIALKVDRSFLAHLRRYDQKRFIFITGTNGKSTTTALLTHMLRKSGLEVVTNAEGANMVTGIMTTLIKEVDLLGRLPDKWYVIECDERNLPAVSQMMSLDQLIVVNLSEDQIQRNGDPGFIWNKIKGAITKQTTAIVNGDEPRARRLGELAGKTYTCGIVPFAQSFQGVSTFYATPCPRCGYELTYEAMNCAYVGPFSCSKCGNTNVGQLDYLASEVDFTQGKMKVNGEPSAICVSIPFFIYNQLLCMAAAEIFCGLDKDTIQKSLFEFANVRGRHDTFIFEGKPVIHLKFKQENPETVQNVFRLIGEDKRNKSIFVALSPIEDFKPFYTDTAYIWTVPLEAYGAHLNASYISGDGVTCYEGARWLEFNGVPRDKIICQAEICYEELFALWRQPEVEVVYIVTLTADWDSKFARFEGNKFQFDDKVLEARGQA